MKMLIFTTRLSEDQWFSAEFTQPAEDRTGICHEQSFCTSVISQVLWGSVRITQKASRIHWPICEFRQQESQRAFGNVDQIHKPKVQNMLPSPRFFRGCKSACLHHGNSREGGIGDNPKGSYPEDNPNCNLRPITPSRESENSSKWDVENGIEESDSRFS